jgi:hypothetical protein
MEQNNIVIFCAIHCTCPHCNKDFDIEPTKNTAIEYTKEKEAELDGRIIEHRPAPEWYGGVAVDAGLHSYAVMKEDQERAAKLIGHKVRVRTVPEYYYTVKILWEESKPPLNTEIPDEELPDKRQSPE